MNFMVEIRDTETTPTIHLSIDNPEIRDWATVKSTVYLLYDAHVVGNADRTAMLQYYVTYNRAC